MGQEQEPPALLIQPEWIAAVLAPWAIAPHPNFSVEEIGGAEALALVSDYRGGEVSPRGQEPTPSFRHAWEAELVDAAFKSLFAESIHESVVRLSALAENLKLPLAARVAAAIYAAVAYGELELEEAAVDLIESFGDPDYLSSKEGALVWAALRIQLATRLLDSGRSDDADEVAAEVRRALEHAEEPFSANFSVSRGVSWPPSEVLADMKIHLLLVSDRLRRSVEPLGGDKWVQVVRARPGWVDSRNLVKAASRDRVFLEEEFGKLTDSLAPKHRFGGSSAVRDGLAALLSAELSGDSDAILRARLALGRLRLLAANTGTDSTPFNIEEALRLLRRSATHTEFRDALRWVRSRGPVSSLARSVSALLDRLEQFGRLPLQNDLALIENGCDFLADGQLSRMIRVILPSTASKAAQKGWKYVDDLWRTVARLVADSGDDDYVAMMLALAVADERYVNSVIWSTAARVSREIRWDQISVATREAWLAVLRKVDLLPHDDQDIEQLEALSYIRQQLEPGGAVMLPASGIELAAEIVNRPKESWRAEQIATAAAACVDALASSMEEARSGVSTFGVYDFGLLAALLADKFQQLHMWSHIVSFLGEAAVNRDFKARTLAYIAAGRAGVPEHDLRRLKEYLPSLMSQTSQYGSMKEEPALFFEAVRAAIRLEVLPVSDFVEPLCRLSSAADSGTRAEVAESLAHVVQRSPDNEWATLLLLQLSWDTDIAVRAEAARSLVWSVDAKTNFGALVQDRILQALQSDGVLVPLRVLHGVQDCKQGGLGVPSVLAHAIEDLATHSVARVIRKAAWKAVLVDA